MYWNMVLDETCKSWWDWAQNAMVIVDRNTRQVRYTDEYYLMKHLSHFVQPGSRLLKVSDHENVLAFRTADNGTAIVTYNPDEDTRFRTFVIDGKKIEVTLKPKSINTIKMNDK